MIYKVEYSKAADRTLRKWKRSNPTLFKKATKVLLDMMQHPRTGIGHPEALVGGNDITWSRHITADDLSCSPFIFAPLDTLRDTIESHWLSFLFSVYLRSA